MLDVDSEPALFGEPDDGQIVGVGDIEAQRLAWQLGLPVGVVREAHISRSPIHVSPQQLTKCQPCDEVAVPVDVEHEARGPSQLVGGQRFPNCPVIRLPPEPHIPEGDDATTDGGKEWVQHDNRASLTLPLAGRIQ